MYNAVKTTSAALAGLAALAAVSSIAKETVPHEDSAVLLRASSPDEARERIRALKAASGGTLPRGGVVVTVDDGRYDLSSPFALTPEDTGTMDCPIVYRAASRGGVVLTGCADLDWRVDGDRRVADMPPGVEPPSLFAASEYLQQELQKSNGEPWFLVEGDRRLRLAQWPRQGAAKVSLRGIETKPRDFHRFTKGTQFSLVDDAGRMPDLARLADEPDLWVHGDWRSAYSDITLPLAGVDVGRGLLNVTEAGDSWRIIEGNPACILNVALELVPGTWAFVSRGRLICAKPSMPGVRPRIVRVGTLLSAEGVSDVTFDGFVFEGCSGNAVAFRNCRDVSLVASTVRMASGWGVRIEGGRGCRVAGCDVYDVGMGGVSASGGMLDTLTPGGHVVDNCHVHDYAWRVWNYAAGVALSGVGNAAVHNLVHHAPHQAMSYSGALHRFEANVVHDVCTMTDDAGAIYAYTTVNAWSRRGNRITGNVFHAVGPVDRRFVEADGIYIDAYTSGTVVEDNIVSDSSYGIFSSGGQDNRIRRNIVVNTRRAGIRRWNLGLVGGKKKRRHVIDGYTNDCDRASYLMKPLIDRGELYSMEFWRMRFPNMLKPLEFDDPAFAHDALFCEITSNVLADAVGVSIADERFTREYTTVGGNVTIDGDPGFVDYFGLDWRLRPDSQARATLGGDTAFAMAGLYDSADRASPAVKWGDGVRRPVPFPTIPFVRDGRACVDESRPITELQFPVDVRAFGWEHRKGENITNTLTIAWMYPRVRKIYVSRDSGLSPAELDEARSLLREWTDGRAELLEEE